MIDRPLVSVIMNCFNGEKYVNEAIESVLSQSYKNWELIFWDNLSTDKSSDIFKNHNDKRLRYFLAKNHTNLSEARTLAIKESHGEIITFLDVDDFWKDSILETQIELYKEDEVLFTCGNFYVITEFSKKNKLFKKKGIPSGEVLNNLLINYSVGMLTLSVLRSAYLKVGGFSSDYHIIGDLDLVIKLAANGKMGSFQEPLAYCRKDGNNESIVKVDLYIKELRIWYKKNYNFYKNTNKKAIKSFYSSILFKEFNYHINNDSLTLKIFINAFRKQSLLNFSKIVVKFFIKKFIGVRV